MGTKNKKDHSYLYIVSTILFIFLGITLTSIINKNKPEDIRAKATATTGVEATGTVVSVDSEIGIVKIDSFAFTSSPSKNLGSWTVTIAKKDNLAHIIPGNMVTILMDAKTVSITNRTLTAKEIKKK